MRQQVIVRQTESSQIYSFIAHDSAENERKEAAGGIGPRSCTNMRLAWLLHQSNLSVGSWEKLNVFGLAAAGI